MTFKKKIAIPVSFLIIIGLTFVLIFTMMRDKLNSESTLSGEPIPAFRLETFDPMPTDTLTFSDKDLKGKVVWVVFFASWCPACVSEHPLLSLIPGKPDFIRLGIAVQDKDSALGRMLSKKGNPFDRIGADRDGQVSNIWNVPGLPQSFLIDKSGAIRFQHSGALTTAIIQKQVLPLIDELLNETPASSESIPMSENVPLE